MPEWETVFFSDARIRLAMGGEGSGKSFQAGLFAVCRSVYDAILHNSNLYWVVGADFEDARTDFDWIVYFQEQLGNIAQLNTSSHKDQQCSLLTRAGQTFITVSAYDPTKLGRDEPDGIVGAEVSRWTQEPFQRCEGRLLRKYPRSWGFFSGSFESSLGWLASLFKQAEGPNSRGIRSFSIPAWANSFVYPGGRNDPAILEAEGSMSPERFEERFGGRPAPPRGIVLAAFRPLDHVDSSLAFDPTLPATLGIDPAGRNVYAVVFLQTVPALGEVWVLDEIYQAGWTHEQVINECKARPLWPLVQDGAIDVAGKQAQGGMPAPIDAWYSDTGLVLWAQRHLVEDLVEKLRWVLSPNPLTGRPRLRIHPRCRGLISELGGGPSPLDGTDRPWRRYETTDGLGPPRPDNCDALKALGYALMGPYGSVQATRSTAASYLHRSKPANMQEFLNG